MDKKYKPKYRSAVGLEYKKNSQRAPAVSVKGELRQADEIVRLAKRYGVPVVERPVLAKALASLSVDERVPTELFEAVALVLARIDQTLK